MGLRKPALALLLAGALLPLPVRRVAAEDADLRSRVADAVARREHLRVQASIGVWDVTTGEQLYSRSPDKLRRTASVMKLATTGAALLALGPDHELTTEVLASAVPSGGVLTGDLVVRGGGDPGFAAHLHASGAQDAVRALARRVREFGLRRVEGDLVLDTSAFPGPARHPGWGWKEGDNAWWSAPVTALTINDACIDVTATPGATSGAPARIEFEPRATTLRLRNETTTVADRARHSIDYRLAAPDELVARGGVWIRSGGYTASLACVDPPALFGDVFRAALGAEGVEVVGASRVQRAASRDDAPFTGLPVARSATQVGRVVEVTNARSQNLYAELLLRELGRHVMRDASFEGGCAAVRSVLGFGPDDGFEQDDGSGLSRGNRATANALGRLLLRMYASSRRVPFMSSLARPADADGTLRKRLRSERFRGRVLGKTGTLRDTSSLAGYVHATDGRVLGFVILCEGSVGRARDLQDEVVSALVGP